MFDRLATRPPFLGRARPYKVYIATCTYLYELWTNYDVNTQFSRTSHSSLVEGVRRGLTPNPDVLCNQHVKFQSLHQWTRETLGVSTIATGHYARVDGNGGGELGGELGGGQSFDCCITFCSLLDLLSIVFAACVL